MTPLKFYLVLFIPIIFALSSCSSESTQQQSNNQQSNNQEANAPVANQTETKKDEESNTTLGRSIPNTEDSRESLGEARDAYIEKLEQQTEHSQPQISSNEDKDTAEISVSANDLISALCTEIGNKLGSVDIVDCLKHELKHSGFSVQKRSLSYRDFKPVAERSPLGKVMVIGGIHGDEFSSVSVVFKWMDILQEHHSGLFHWRFLPSANPDGLVARASKRQNANGVDLNRNFPTQDWQQNALKYWREETGNNTRRYPGNTANSEPETQWLIEQVKAFDPDVIISMHAPYHLVDYDGPPTAPNQLGSLYLRQLGVYPGSMGNYIGVDKKMPIVTVELKSAGIMPPKEEIDGMWTDLIRWLRSQLEKNSSQQWQQSPEEIPG